MEKVFDKVYANFVEEIDANDNGIDTHDGEPRYQVLPNLFLSPIQATKRQNELWSRFGKLFFREFP